MVELKSNLALALVHYPVYNKHHEVVTTAITNLDIHDIARSSKTFGLDNYYLVTPSSHQQELAARITGHWQDGWGASYNPDRKDALDIISTVNSVDEAIRDLESQFNRPVTTVVTAAKQRPGSLSFQQFRHQLESDLNAPYLLLFGTGWGLSDECFEKADIMLDPIYGCGSYNHLSVRSAAAIMLDRLKGTAHES